MLTPVAAVLALGSEPIFIEPMSISAGMDTAVALSDVAELAV